MLDTPAGTLNEYTPDELNDVVAAAATPAPDHPTTATAPSTPSDSPHARSRKR
jgi:hypothetical protein